MDFRQASATDISEEEVHKAPQELIESIIQENTKKIIVAELNSPLSTPSTADQI